jgi:hypothetical protein
MQREKQPTVFTTKGANRKEHQSKRKQITPELPYKEAGFSTSHDNYN